VILESNIIEKLDCLGRKQYDIIELQLNIGVYTFILQLFVRTLWNDQGDIILGSPWMETVDSFILNMKKKFLTFSYKKKKNNATRSYSEVELSNTRRHTKYLKSKFSRR